MEGADERIERIERMEALLDEATAAAEGLSRAIAAFRAAGTAFDELETYYRGAWRADYEADERGELPPELKRGVLSQDALYDVLAERDRLRPALPSL